MKRENSGLDERLVWEKEYSQDWGGWDGVGRDGIGRMEKHGTKRILGWEGW